MAHKNLFSWKKKFFCCTAVAIGIYSLKKSTYFFGNCEDMYVSGLSSKNVYIKNDSGREYNRYNWFGSKYRTFLEMSKSKNKYLRLCATKYFAENSDLEDWECRMIAQASEPNLIIGLARSPHINKLFFLPPPFKDLETGNVKEELYELLTSLPNIEDDFSIQSLIQQAKFLALEQLYPDQKCFIELDEFYNIYNAEQVKKASIAYDGIILHILLIYSTSKLHRHLMASKGLFKMLLKISKYHDNNILYQSLIARILANFTLEEKFKHDLHLTGWIGKLAIWSRSPFIELNLPSAKSLANLDNDCMYHSLYENGIYLLYPLTRQNDLQLSSDVIFVHGLLGSTFWTWRQNDSKKNLQNLNSKKEACSTLIQTDDINNTYTKCWPKDWLAYDLPSARIISIDYNTSISNWKVKWPQHTEKDSLEAKAKSLINKLLLSNVGNKPIVWISHSMGGLLVKKIIIEALKNETTKSIAENTVGVIFLSVPHKGSELANTLQSILYIFQPSVEILELTKGSPNLLVLHREFQEYIEKNNIAVLSFGETKKTKWGLKSSIFVSEDSSDPGFGEFYCLPTDHLGISKPESKDSVLYSTIVKFLQFNVPISKPTSQKYSKLEYELFKILHVIL